MNLESWLEQFQRRTPVGKALLIGGTAFRAGARAVDSALKSAATVIADAERAFRDELDPNVTDARIVEEGELPHNSGSRL